MDETNGETDDQQVEEQQLQQNNVFVIVTDGTTDEAEKLELPTDLKDCSLGLSTLVHAFPGAHGLKYRNPTSGAFRALMIDSTGTKFLPPFGTGWGETVYHVIYKEVSKQRHNDQNTKRKKMMDYSGDESDGAELNEGATAKQKRFDQQNRAVIAPPAGAGTTTTTTTTAATESDPDEESCVDLIVLGLPFKSTKDTLKDYFEQHFGQVVVSEIKTDFRTGKSKGFGFIKFAEYKAQLKVLAQHLHSIDGRNCQVKIPDSKADTVNKKQQSPKIFVGRLQESMDYADVKDFFNEEAKKINPNASVVDVFIPKPFRAFAFVTFSEASVAQELIKKHEVVMNGTSLNLGPAAPKESASPAINQPHLISARTQSGAGGKRPNRGYDDYGYTNRYNEYSQDFSPYNYDRRYSGFSGDNRSSYGEDIWTGDSFPSSGGPVRGDGRNSMGGAFANRYSPVPMAGRSGRINQRPMGGPPSSNTLASGMDALNLNQMNQTLNQMNPDMVSAAWQAFWQTLNNPNNGPAPNMAAMHSQQHQGMQQNAMPSPWLKPDER